MQRKVEGRSPIGLAKGGLREKGAEKGADSYRLDSVRRVVGMCENVCRKKRRRSGEGTMRAVFQYGKSV